MRASLLALLVLGGVVAAVLLEVALVAGGADPLDDLWRDGAREVLELGVELVEGLLGQPDHADLLGDASGCSCRCRSVVVRHGRLASGRVDRVRPIAGRARSTDGEPSGGSDGAAETTRGQQVQPTAAADGVSAVGPGRRRCSRYVDRGGPALGADGRPSVGARRRRGEGAARRRPVVLGQRPHACSWRRTSSSWTATSTRAVAVWSSTTSKPTSCGLDLRRAPAPDAAQASQPARPRPARRPRRPRPDAATGGGAPYRSARVCVSRPRCVARSATTRLDAAHDLRTPSTRPRRRPPADARARPPRRRVEQGRGVARRSTSPRASTSTSPPAPAASAARSSTRRWTAPTSLANITEVRRQEMERARDILGVRQDWLGFVDSGWPEGDPKPPLPEGCFALVPLEEAAEPLVRLIRDVPAARADDVRREAAATRTPTTSGATRSASRRSRRPATPSASPTPGEPWQPLKLYYHHGFNRAADAGDPRRDARPRPRVAVRRAARGVEARARVGRRRITTRVPCGDYFGVRDQALLAHATQIDPDGFWFAIPRELQAAGLADRGLRAGHQPRRDHAARGRPVRRHPAG